MGRFWWGVMLFAWIGSTHASVRDGIEASMLVEGEIEVDEQGVVIGYELDDRDRLPDDVERFLDTKVAAWRFDATAIDRRPAATRNYMNLLVVAAPKEDGSYRMELRGASFQPVDQPDQPTALDMILPSYPRAAARKGVSGTVYLMLRVGADGSVEDAIAEQVNLRTAFRRESEMEYWRGILAGPTVDQARKWTFHPLKNRQSADGKVRSIRVPVAYWLGDGKAAYGEWSAYIPGPRRHAPWAVGDDGVSLETLADGGLYPVGRPGALHLLPDSNGG